VTIDPSLARRLEARCLDYCCGGATTLETARAQHGLDPVEVLDQFTSASTGTASAGWSTMDVVELVNHIEATHHQFLWTELPRPAALLDEVVSVHGARHPELADIHACFTAIRADLERHLTKEELILFPMVRELATADAAPSFRCGSIQSPISAMLSEHDAVGALLRQLRDLTSAYQRPADGCASYVALFNGLDELEADTHLHIHKGDNLLFPAAVELEEQLVS
jgi:regulator of cell morphogenesis and NO signaling